MSYVIFLDALSGVEYFVFMKTETTAALNILLATMTAAQREALMNALSMHIENEECNDEDGSVEDVLESEGHQFLVAVRDAAIVSL